MSNISYMSGPILTQLSKLVNGQEVGSHVVVDLVVLHAELGVLLAGVATLLRSGGSLVSPPPCPRSSPPTASGAGPTGTWTTFCFLSPCHPPSPSSCFSSAFCSGRTTP